MKLNANDWPRLQIPLLALAVMLALGAASILVARAELGDAQARLANIQQERKEIDNKLRQVRSEENEIRQKAAVFNELQSRRILGEEQRLEWVELLEEIRARHRLPEMRYEIAPRQPLEKSPSGQLALYASTMKLELKLLHEEDLTRLLDDLRREAPALIQPRRCDISRLARTAADGASTASLQAGCLIDWITVRKADSAEGLAK